MKPEIIEKIHEHYEHAKEKHPYFCDMITCLSEDGANTLWIFTEPHLRQK